MVAALAGSEPVGGGSLGVSSKRLRKPNAHHSGADAPRRRRLDWPLFETPGRPGMKRREFLTLPVQSLGGVLLYTLVGDAVRLQAQTREIRVPLRFFTAAEARVVQAACERIFPSDASGPGATEAGVAIYIDRQLAGPYGSDKYRFTQPPFVESVPEHGYQGKQNPGEIYREGIRELANFAELPPEQQDQRLRLIETSMFFRLLR